MHESTVSRVVNNKYMHTPQGVYEMKFFFHSGISSSYRRERVVGDDQAAHPKIIEAKTRRPLSDSKIMNILQRKARAGAADDREVPRRAEDSDVESAQSLY